MFFAEIFAEFQEIAEKQSTFLKFCKFLEFLRCKGQAGSKMKMPPLLLRLIATFIITYGPFYREEKEHVFSQFL